MHAEHSRIRHAGSAWSAAGGALHGYLAIVLASVLVAACSPSATPPEPAFARECLSVGGAREAVLNIVAPGDGALRIGIEERGISAIGVLDNNAETSAASPVERFGTIVLIASARGSESHSVRIRAEDSPDITGEVCVSASLIQTSDGARLRAERDFAAAGRAVHTHDWESAFNGYLSAARGFDHLGFPSAAAMARHSMAELAYLRFDRKRDSYALAGEALAEYGAAAEPIFAGLIAGLQAKALLDMPGSDAHVVASAVRERLSIARKYDGASRFGARELPRLDIMTGFLEFMLDEPERARGFFVKAVQRCREMRDWDCYAIASQDLAQLAEENKNYASALTEYADALRLLPPELDLKLTADIWNNLGRLQGVVGLFSSSERSHAAAMRAYGLLGDCQGVRRSLARSGNLLVQVGTLADAESELEQAASLDCPTLLANTNRSSAPGGPAQVSAAMPSVPQLSSGKPDMRAQPCAQPLEANTLSTDNKMVVFNSLLSISDALMLEGDSAQAQRCLDAAQRYASTSRSQIRLANARGTLLLDRKDAEAARVAFEQALRIADAAELPSTYEHRGFAQLGIAKSALLAGKVSDALQGSYQALESSVARGDIDQSVTSLRLVAASYRQSGALTAATHTLETAADLVEVIPIDELDGEKRATYLATQHKVFAELTDLFASQGGSDDAMPWLAFSTSERGRARSLRYAITQTARDASSPLEAPPVARYEQLLRDVIRITPHADAGQARHELVDEIDAAALRERGAIEPFDRATLKRTLEDLDATLVEYSVGSHDMFAFVISSDNARVVRLGDRGDIASAAADLRDLLRNAESPASDVRTAAQHLARLVLWPFSEQLSGRRIIFVPDDALHTIPFAVLPWSAHSDGQLVVSRAETIIAPSALFLTHSHHAGTMRSNAPRIELMGDPVFRVSEWRRECIDADADASYAKPTGRATRAISDWTESLPRLPSTRSEVAMIAKFARESRPASRIETLVGCAAVPAALRKAAAEGVDLLHIATHARIDAQRPRLSALALTPESAGGASAFGLLDILGLKLNSRLVVLSACDTSRGRLLPGEGVLGPAQAFLQAGAAAVVASYWRVDDEMTSNFMRRFYGYLLTDHLSTLAALRKAQLDHAGAGNTFEWAAFALYGWPDSSL